MPTVHVKTMGCKVNRCDSREIEAGFTALGYQIAEDADGADVVILNTCCVTAKADKEVSYLIRKLKRSSPDALLVATGCYAQVAGSMLEKSELLDDYVTNDDKQTLHQRVHQHYQKIAHAHQRQPAAQEPLSTAKKKRLTRGFLKIQDGCDSFCSYCIVPLARGRPRSVEKKAVLDQVASMVAEGYKVLVLTGIHLGCYGKDLTTYATCEEPLADLIDTILASFSEILRLRISSIEPMELTRTLLVTLSQHRNRVCDHFHLPLQSGSDRILALMNRPYRAADFLGKMAEIRHYFPGANITTDIIVGFPSESEADFAETLNLAAQISGSGFHLFPFSPRPETAASKMKERVDDTLIKDRIKRLKELSETISTQFKAEFLGKTAEVLWEGRSQKDRALKGYTANYLKVTAPYVSTIKRGQLSYCLLSAIDETGAIVAELVPSQP